MTRKPADSVEPRATRHRAQARLRSKDFGTCTHHGALEAVSMGPAATRTPIDHRKSTVGQ